MTVVILAVRRWDALPRVSFRKLGTPPSYVPGTSHCAGRLQAGWRCLLRLRTSISYLRPLGFHASRADMQKLKASQQRAHQVSQQKTRIITQSTRITLFPRLNSCQQAIISLQILIRPPAWATDLEKLGSLLPSCSRRQSWAQMSTRKLTEQMH